MSSGVESSPVNLHAEWWDIAEEKAWSEDRLKNRRSVLEYAGVTYEDALSQSYPTPDQKLIIRIVFEEAQRKANEVVPDYIPSYVAESLPVGQEAA